MCVGIGYLVFLLPVVAIIAAILGYWYAKHMITADTDDG